MKNDYLKKIKLPDRPGVYFFLHGKEIIYIGKATSLKDRVKSYFSNDLIETRGPIILDMVFKADKIKWDTTDSVLEALILEANLIKKHQPKYNTKEKSDKSFNYVCITKPARLNSRSGGEELPKVIILRRKDLENFAPVNFSPLRPSLGASGSKWDPRGQKIHRGSIFGPFPNSTQLREALKIVRRIFPFLDDKSKNYLEFYKQINLVPDLSHRTLYLHNIKNIKLFFEGKKKRILQNLKKEMKEYAGNHAFEKAGEIKRQVFALQHINDIALIKNNGAAGNKIFDPAPFFGRIKGNKAGPSDAKISLSAAPFRIEAYDVAHMGGKNMVGVMTVVQNGEIEKSEYKKFSARGGSAFGGKTVLGNSKANDVAALKEVLERRLNHPEWPYPSLIVVDGGLAQINAAKAVLAKMGLKINVVSVLKDERHKPKAIIGDEKIGTKYKREILLANGEAHRFAISYHKKMRNKNFLKK